MMNSKIGYFYRNNIYDRVIQSVYYLKKKNEQLLNQNVMNLYNK